MENRIQHELHSAKYSDMTAEDFHKALEEGMQMLRVGNLRKNSKAVNIALDYNLELMSDLLVQETLS